MLKAASAGLREIWRRICRPIFRPHVNPSLRFPARPRGQVSGRFRGCSSRPRNRNELLLEELIDEIPVSAPSASPANNLRWQYAYFLGGLCHDLGKLFEMDVRNGQRQWCPLHETYADFLRGAKADPVMRWRQDRARGAHALLSPWLVHDVLSRADFEYIGREGLRIFQGQNRVIGKYGKRSRCLNRCK